jgi:hypothetical protein
MHRFYVTTVLAALLSSAPLAAQDVRQDTTTKAASSVAAPSAVDFTARWAPPAATAATTRSFAPAPIAPMFVPRQPSSRSTAMMVVGGAAILVGAVIGDDAGQIIMISGGVIGLLGLWEHLK